MPPLGLTMTALYLYGSSYLANIREAERRYRIVVSTPRCGRGNPGSNPGTDTHTHTKKIKRELDWLFVFVCVLGDQSLGF